MNNRMSWDPFRLRQIHSFLLALWEQGLRLENQMSEFTDALARVQKDVGDIKTDVQGVLAKLNSGDTAGATAALNQIATDLEGVDTGLKGALGAAQPAAGGTPPA